MTGRGVRRASSVLAGPLHDLRHDVCAVELSLSRERNEQRLLQRRHCRSTPSAFAI